MLVRLSPGYCGSLVLSLIGCTMVQAANLTDPFGVRSVHDHHQAPAPFDPLWSLGLHARMSQIDNVSVLAASCSSSAD